jgi:uncharacterized membrane protein
MEPFDDRIANLENNLSRLLKEAGEISLSLKELKSTVHHPKEEIPETPPPLPDYLTPALPVAEIEEPEEVIKPKPIHRPVIKPKYNGSLELQLGRVWFVRIGIILLTTGLVFLSSYTYHNYVRDLAPGTRLGLFYLLSALLTGAGLFFETWKDSLRNYGRIVAAGGLATIYYCSYAAYHVEALKVIDNQIIASLLLTFSAGLFCSVSLWKKSRVMLSTSLGLAFYSVSINPNGVMVCVSSLILAAFGITMMKRTNWSATGFVVLIGSYLSYTWWQLSIAQESLDTQFFLITYWLLFVAATLSRNNTGSERTQGIFSSINHSSFFLLFSLNLNTFTWIEHHWAFCLVMGTALIGIGLLGKSRLSTHSLLLHFAKGVGLITLGITLKLTGHILFLTLLIESLLLLAICFRHPHPLARLASQIVGGIGLLFALKPFFSVAPVTSIAWLIAALFCLAYSALDRLLQKDLDQFKSNPVSVIATLFSFGFIFFGATELWPIEHRLYFIALPGALASLGVLTRTGRTLFLDFLLVSLVISPIALFTLFTQNSPSPFIFSIGALIALLGSAASSLSQRKLEDPLWLTIFGANTAIQLAIATLLFVFEILSQNISGESKLLLLSLIPIAGTLVSLRTKILPHSTIPAFSYLALIFAGSANETMWLLITFIALGHFLVVYKFHELADKPWLEKCTYILTTLFFLFWILIEVSQPLVLLTWTATSILLTTRFVSKKLTNFSSTLYFLVATEAFFFEAAQSSSIYFALIAPIALHLWSSHQDKKSPFHLLAIGVATATWIQISRDSPLNSLSAAWAITGTLILLTGLLFRSRTFRLSALIILFASLGHVMLIDIVKLDPLPRILSFITLGLGLLALGFVYNRWQERLKHML